MIQHSAFAFLCVAWMMSGYCQAQQSLDPNHARKMAAGIELFKSDVRTLFVGRCVKCHGGEKNDGELDLSTREGLMKGGNSGVSVDLESPQKSLLIQLIRHEQEPFMPEDGAQLDDRQVKAIEKWIGLGAPYDRPLVEKKDADPTAWTRKAIDTDARDFWIFQPWKPISPPMISDNRWSRNDVDRFVLEKLRSAGLQPNQPAEPRVLMRRASLDLIGLPPEPLDERSLLQADRWEKMVDTLLVSKHFGERFARHWLDLARFAESFGFEQDYDRPHAFQYRDFVIRAMNSDMPFHQFAAWQIAGDELAPTNPEAMLATGFLGAGVFPTQLTEKEFESARYDELDDMVATFGTSFLGLTVGCARCHDHKFDPIPSRDYYQMISVFRNTIRSNVEIEMDPEGDKRRTEQWEAEHAPLLQALATFESNELPMRFDAMLKELREGRETNSDKPGARNGWILPISATVKSDAGAVFTPQSDGSFLASGTNASSDRYTLVIETLSNKLSGIRLDAFNDPSLPQGGPGRAANGNIGLSKIRVFAQALDESTPMLEIPLIHPVATFEQNSSGLSIASSLDDNPQSGWAVDPQFNKPHSAAFQFSNPVVHDHGVRLSVVLDFNLNTQHNIGRPRVAITQDEVLPPLDMIPNDSQMLISEMRKLIQQDPAAVSDVVRKKLMSLFKTSDQRWLELKKAIDEHYASKPKPQTVTAMVCSEGVKPIPNHGDDRGYPHFYPQAYFLKRGDVNQKQGEADVGFVQALTRTESGQDIDWGRWRFEPAKDTKTSSRRAALATWLTDVEHGAGQQLARVIVNRVWQYHFGQGLVATPSDFGFQGERASHPELLDYLAQRLIEGGWHLKPIHKWIMMSATYQQSSTFDASKSAIDPKNRLLWRFSPRRLEAESIRDSILSVSGQLNTTMFGPGTLDESMKRRSIYFFIKRSQLIPFMQVFDSPEPLVSVGQRPSTTIAPQALMFMNNQFVREWAVGFANRVIAEQPGELSKQIEHAYRIALGRSPTPLEASQSKAFVESELASYQSDSIADPTANAMADLCQILFSLNEFIYID